MRRSSSNPPAIRSALGALVVVLAGCGASQAANGGDAGASSVTVSAAAGRGPSSDASSGAGGAGGGAPPASAGATPGTSAGGSVLAVGGADSTGGRSSFGTAGSSDTSAAGSVAGSASNAGSGGTAAVSCGEVNGSTRAIAFGTTLNARAQVCESQALAHSLANPSSNAWRAKGDQKRSYAFKAAGVSIPYRVVVPSTWDGSAELPLVMFLHGAGNDESSYLDQNNKQLVTLAQQHGYLLVSPLGYQGAYGNFLRLPAVFGETAEADQKIAEITAATEKTNELSEKDVINVLELVLAEYPIARGAMFLTGHSMGSGGTWYIGAKYADYWAALAPMSGPFVQKAGYLWDAVRPLPIFVSEGTQAASLAGSHALRDWMSANGFQIEYQEVNADHPGMVPLVLPSVFTYFDKLRTP